MDYLRNSRRLVLECQQGNGIDKRSLHECVLLEVSSDKDSRIRQREEPKKFIAWLPLHRARLSCSHTRWVQMARLTSREIVTFSFRSTTFETMGVPVTADAHAQSSFPCLQDVHGVYADVHDGDEGQIDINNDGVLAVPEVTRPDRSRSALRV